VDAFTLDGQMPVEECGNMILMVYSVCIADGNFDMAKENLDLLRKWSRYLTQYGEDPGEQLCTDDFAGHLKGNVNLSAKAIMGVAAYSKILEKLGEKEESVEMWKKAQEMAESWLRRADMGGYTALTFEKVGWSQKYNLVWDKLFGTDIIPEDVIKTEFKSYKKHMNRYGLPLDNRSLYTKSDWLIWTATLAELKDDFMEIVDPLWDAYNSSETRLPMTDWYWTHSATIRGFRHRSVVGGYWIKLLEYTEKMKID